VIAARRAAMEAKGDAAWQPAEPRKRAVSTALKAYAALATSASRGAVRDLNALKRR
jgi:dihydroxy-acid dehydratase